MGRGGFLTRLAVSFALLASGTAAVVGVRTTRVAERHLVEQLAERLQAQAALLADGLPAPAALGPWCAAAGRRVAERVTVIAADGRVLCDSEVDPGALGKIENHAGRPEVRAALAGAPGSDVRRSRSVGRDYLYAAVPLASGGAFRLALPLADVRERVAGLRWATAAAGALCLAVALVLAGLAALSLNRPLAALADAADRIAGGDFSVRADPAAAGELGRLGGLLNQLTVRVGAALAELASDKARIEATLANMVECVALVGSDGRVETLNPAMEVLFGLRASEARSKPLLETLRHPPLKALVDGALGGEARAGEITLFTPEERVFSAQANPVREGARTTGAVLVLHDITRLRRLEEVRKEFVANVSHELRTPLASIKGFAETLRRGALEDPAVRLEFVGTIEEQADRLTALVDDLLELASVEGGRRPLKSEELALAEAVSAVLSGLAPIAEAAGVAVAGPSDGAPRVRADRDALERVLRNLIENAVKYNRRGGRVDVRAAREGGLVRVSVADTGLGIPAAALPRVFERFYRVDAARSRELGGTGLGLSIVKHLVEAMGGAASVESVEGQGSTFSFTLPAA